MTIQQLIAKRLRLFARRKVITTIDGNYESVFRGKGIELDSLRPYVIGDSVKDIDWAATARTGEAHTRQYVPLRDQRIVVVADTSPSMMVASEDGMKKVEALYGMIVTLGMFVRKNRDLLAICATKPDGKVSLSKFSNTNNHIESILRDTDFAINHTPPSHTQSLPSLLQHTLHSLKQRSAIFIASDGIYDTAELKSYLLKLGVRHLVFFMQIQPSSPLSGQIFEDNTSVDIENGQSLPTELAQDAKLKKEWQIMASEWQINMQKTCKSSGTAYGYVKKAEDIPEVLRSMFILSKKYARRH